MKYIKLNTYLHLGLYCFIHKYQNENLKRGKKRVIGLILSWLHLLILVQKYTFSHTHNVHTYTHVDNEMTSANGWMDGVGWDGWLTHYIVCMLKIHTNKYLTFKLILCCDIFFFGFSAVISFLFRFFVRSLAIIVGWFLGISQSLSYHKFSLINMK